MSMKRPRTRVLALSACAVLATASCEVVVDDPGVNSPPTLPPISSTPTTAATAPPKPVVTIPAPTIPIPIPVPTIPIPPPTVPAPTTTAPAPTTTTAPAPTITWLHYDTPAGRLTVAHGATGLEFWAMAPNPGWEFYTKKDTANLVHVLYRNNGTGQEAGMKVTQPQGNPASSFDLDGTVTAPSPSASTVEPPRSSASG